MGRPRRSGGVTSALAPFLPLGCLFGLLATLFVLSPPTIETPEGPGPRGGRSASAPARERGKPPGAELVVAGTGGAGAYLRNSRDRSDRKLGLPEGTLLLDRGGSPDPAWLRVMVVPEGPEGWLPVDYVAELP